MAAVLSTEDSFASHIEDTIRVGCGLARRETVELVVRGGPAAVERLLEIGTRFDRDATGELELSREGGHSHARIVHANGDATGTEMQRALSRALGEHPRITLFPHVFALDVVCDPEGSVLGVLVRTAREDLATVSASQVILATGGAGQVYRETTNPVIATGDGIAMAFRAGARVRDPEFVQFHPTCLYIAGAARVLISEIVRGAGGVLRDRFGRRFMPEYHEDAELAPRDVVSRAVFERMVATRDTSVYLDLSGIAEDPHKLFPGISRVCRFFGIDIARDPVPVRPGAHYMIGGVEADIDGRTNVPGLWAVGECASSGLHGANRMGSNSLLEGLVLGVRAGEAAAAAATPVDLRSLRYAEVGEGEGPPPGLQVNITDVVYSLKSMMWRQMGVEREAAGLRDALEKITFWSNAVTALAPSEPRTFELVNMLTVARLATFAALQRQESRGVHYRTDFRETLEELRAHTILAPVISGKSIRYARLFHEPLNEPVPSS
jgi:L-aspartate oxidase